MAKRIFKCNTCKSVFSYSEKYDAHYCARCAKWAEKKCSDKQCMYCAKRPDDPLTQFYHHYSDGPI